MYLDFVYYLTPSGRRYQSLVDFVHKVSREIVAVRQKLLVALQINTSFCFVLVFAKLC